MENKTQSSKKETLTHSTSEVVPGSILFVPLKCQYFQKEIKKGRNNQVVPGFEPGLSEMEGATPFPGIESGVSSKSEVITTTLHNRFCCCCILDFQLGILTLCCGSSESCLTLCLAKPPPDTPPQRMELQMSQEKPRAGSIHNPQQ